MNIAPPSSPAWRWPVIRLRWALWAGLFFLLNALWRASVVTLDLRASGSDTPWMEPLVWEMTSGFLVWALLPLIQTAALNAPWRQVPWRRFLGLHLAAATLFWLLHVGGMWGLRLLIYPAMGWGPYHYGRILPRILMEGGKDLIGFALLATVFHVLEARRLRQARELAAARLETELREARLQALSAQLDPHFLFNALNTLSSVMYEDVPKADQLLTALGQMLRDGLQSEGSAWTLDRELTHLQHYLAFAEARFGDRLRVEQSIEAGLGALAVPRFSIQRLVENALKHNEATPGRVLHVSIAAAREEGAARITVADDGVGFLNGSGGGLGLDNLRRSLFLMHGEDGALAAGDGARGGAVVTLKIPMEAARG